MKVFRIKMQKRSLLLRSIQTRARTQFFLAFRFVIFPAKERRRRRKHLQYGIEAMLFFSNGTQTHQKRLKFYRRI